MEQIEMFGDNIDPHNRCRVENFFDKFMENVVTKLIFVLLFEEIEKAKPVSIFKNRFHNQQLHDDIHIQTK